MNRRTKELVLREYDDTGADTLEKHWAQIEYTAYWCIHLLLSQSEVVGVIPEGVDDVLLIKSGYIELHQVKCRDETQPPWTTADVLPILSSQYFRRKPLNQPCHFHFVSDHLADTKTQLKPGISYGQLARLKQLLDINHDGGEFTDKELEELIELEDVILPRIVSIMAYKGEQIEIEQARELLRNTWIDTKSVHVRNRRPPYDELSQAFRHAQPGQPECTLSQLDEIYKRLLNLIVKKITEGKSLEERKIVRDDVLACRSVSFAVEPDLPDLSLLQGRTRADKKAIYGGFDASLMPTYALQMRRAQEKIRRFETLGLNEKVQDLSLALVTIQAQTRLRLSQKYSDHKIGPQILRAVEPQIPECINTYFHDACEVDKPFCFGLLWLSTDECTLYWHRAGGDKQA